MKIMKYNTLLFFLLFNSACAYCAKWNILQVYHQVGQASKGFSVARSFSTISTETPISEKLSVRWAAKLDKIETNCLTGIRKVDPMLADIGKEWLDLFKEAGAYFDKGSLGHGFMGAAFDRELSEAKMSWEHRIRQLKKIGVTLPERDIENCDAIIQEYRRIIYQSEDLR